MIKTLLKAIPVIYATFEMTVANNLGPMQLIYAIKAQGTNHFWVHWVLYQLEN